MAVFFGVPKRQRRIYKLWLEGVAPSFVLEISSKGTWLEDMGAKRALCARLGVQEYLLFDPEGEWLEPPFQAFTHEGGDLRRVALSSRAPSDPIATPPGATDAQAGERFESRVLGVTVQRAGQHLVLTDASTGQRLLRPEELSQARASAERTQRDAERAQRDAERAQRDAERAQRDAERARDDAQARVAALETELARLRAAERDRD